MQIEFSEQLKKAIRMYVLIKDVNGQRGRTVRGGNHLPAPAIAAASASAALSTSASVLQHSPTSDSTGTQTNR